MKFERTLAILGACAVILTAAGCKSSDIADNTLPAASGNVDTTAATATETEIAAETSGELTVPAVDTTSGAYEPTDTTAETSVVEVTSITEIDGEEYVVGYTSSQEQTTTPAETTTTVAETAETTAETTAPLPTLDDIAMRIESDGEITTETHYFDLYVEYIGSSDTEKFTVGLSDYRLQKYEDGKWRNIEFPDNFVSGTSGYYGLELCKDYPSEKFIIPLVGYKEPVTAGKYRVIKRIGGASGVDFAEEFEVADAAPAPESDGAASDPKADDFTVSINNDRPVTINTNILKCELRFVGEHDDTIYLASNGYELEREKDGKWVEVPFSEEIDAITTAYEFGGYNGDSGKFNVKLNEKYYKEPITVGKYRIVKRVWANIDWDDEDFTTESYFGTDGRGTKYYAEFEIADAPEGKMELVNENRSITLDIYEIKPDEFICYNYIPLPGTYHIMCDTSKYEDYCVGDRIEVYYYSIFRLPNDRFDYYYIEPESIDMSNAQLDPDVEYKPVIYLYPEKPAEVSVQLDYNGRLTVTDPEYRDGWTVTANPDGTLICEGREYPYLFWEGERNYELSFDKGFCVSGNDTEKFLREKLALLGLNEKETVDFLGFWLPYMRGNAYNVISFAGAEYTDNAKLDISPEPDTVIRVYMQFAASDVPVELPEQELAPAPARSGFTVVEWGGSVRK